MYADDVQIYISVPLNTLFGAINDINSDIEAICQWSARNCLRVNPIKSQCILIGSQKHLNSHDYAFLPPVSLAEVAIPFSKVVKDLGLILNSNLSWSGHVASICKKSYGILHSIHRHKNFLPFKAKLALVQSLVFPIIDYCDVVYADLSSNLANKLQRIQNSCVRLLFGLKRRDHLSEYYDRLKWLRLDEKRRLNRLTVVFKSLKGFIPDYLKNKLVLLRDSHKFNNTRGKNDYILNIPAHKTQFYSNSFITAAARDWNNLPSALRSSATVASFNHRAKKHIIETCQ